MSHGNFIQVLNRKEVLALAFGAMIGWGWAVLGAVFYMSARVAHGNEAARIIERELETGRTGVL